MIRLRSRGAVGENGQRAGKHPVPMHGRFRTIMSQHDLNAERRLLEDDTVAAIQSGQQREHHWSKRCGEDEIEPQEAAATDLTRNGSGD